MTPVVSGAGATVQYWHEFQTEVIWQQAPPVQNQWYTVLDTTEDAAIIMLSLSQTNDEAAGKNLETRVTIDGEVLSHGPASLGNNAWRMLKLHKQQAGLDGDSGDRNLALYTELKGHSVKIEMRITAALGTNQVIKAIVKYTQVKAT